MPSTPAQLLSFATAASLPLRRSSRLRAAPRASPIVSRAAATAPVAAPVAAPQWHVTKAPDRCFRLTLTLACGQAFRWHDCGVLPFPRAYRGLAREWAGVVGTRLLVLRQAEEEPPDKHDDPVWWRVAAGEEKGAHEAVQDYFRLDHDLTKRVERFCHADPKYNTAFPVYRGCRVIRQDPVECLFGFICSSNNNVKRISAMVLDMARQYGVKVGEHAGKEHFLFPSVDALVESATEEELRAAGFGYRAKFIVGTAEMLQKDAAASRVSPEELLLSYRGMERKEVAQLLVRFPGVGRKVASCVALFSLDQLGEIPCDTHIWQIATTYIPEIKQKSLTERVYDQVGDFFRDKFGEEDAGLAQTMLFVGELADFKELMSNGNRKSTAAKKRTKRRSKAVKVEKKEEIKIEKNENITEATSHGEQSNASATGASVLREPSPNSVTGAVTKKREVVKTQVKDETTIVAESKKESDFVIVNEELLGVPTGTEKQAFEEPHAKRQKTESVLVDQCTDER